MKLITKSIVSLTVSLLSVMGLFSQDVTGTWQGTLNVQGTNLEIAFHIEQQDSTYITLMDSPSQGGYGIATTKTIFDKNKLEISANDLGIFYGGTLHTDTITGTFKQGVMTLPLLLTRTDEVKQLLRPQEPKASYPYEVEEITFTNTKENIDLAGTLTIPKGKEKYPAVILIAGSGPNDRDEKIFGHKPFWILADYLTRQGIAVLRYDKRGVGKSEGEYFIATTQHFAEDAESAFSYLKTRTEIDPSNIGLIGHSEGGIIAPMIAAKNKEVQFIVLMAGLGVTGTDLVLAQNRLAFDKMALTEEVKNDLMQRLTNIYAEASNWTEYVGTDEERNQLKQELSIMWRNLPQEMRANVTKDNYIEKTTLNITSTWFRHFLKIKPSEYLQKLSIPVFAINGENDTQVEYKTNLAKIEVALNKGNNKNYTIKPYPHLNHLFQESTTGEIDEYGKIEQTISPVVLSDIAKWIKQQVE